MKPIENPLIKNDIIYRYIDSCYYGSPFSSFWEGGINSYMKSMIKEVKIIQKQSSRKWKVLIGEENYTMTKKKVITFLIKIHFHQL